MSRSSSFRTSNLSKALESTSLSETASTDNKDDAPAPRSGEKYDERLSVITGNSIDSLAPETIARIFSYLDPRTLRCCAYVCRTWRALVDLDTTWRSAFAVAFGLDQRELQISHWVRDGKSNASFLRIAPALRRLDAVSWRAEYTTRIAVLRRWRKSRSSTILTNPRIGNLDALASSQSQHFVLSLSYGFSVASRSNAFTGKVAKDFLDASGFTSRAPNGQPNVEFSPEASVLATDAHASRIVWGLRTGDVTLTTIDWKGQNARGTVRNRSFTHGTAHNASVTAIAFPMQADLGGAHGVHRSAEQHRQQLSLAGDAAPTFATAAADGSVLIWHNKHDAPIWRATCQHTASQQPSSGANSADHALDDGPIDHLVYSPIHGVLIAARRSGVLCIWTRLPVKALAAQYTQPMRERQSASMPASPDSSKPSFVMNIGRVAKIELDTYDDDRDCVTFLLHRHKEHVFYRYDIQCRSSKVHTVVFGAPNISMLTSIRADFDLRDPRPALPTSILAQKRAARFTERKFVCAGTASGGIGVWEWNAAGAFSEESQRSWQATRTPQVADAQAAPALVVVGHSNAITALDVTPSLLFAGTEDGTIKVMDLLTGHHLRTFNDRAAKRQPARMLANGQLTEEQASRFRVNQIIANNEQFIAAIGTQVLAWRSSEVSDTTPSDPRTVTTRKSRATDRLRARADWDRVVQEEQQWMDAERSEQANAEAQQRATHTAMQGTLDEDSALNYALMLSRDEGQDVPTPPVITQTASTEDHQQQSQMDELPYDLLYEDQHLTMSDGDSDAAMIASPTISSLTSPTNRAWDTYHHAAGRLNTTNEQTGSFSKLRTVAVPRSARFETPSSSAKNSSLSTTPLQLGSDHEWPEMQPSSLPNSQPRSFERAIGAWATSSPSVRAVDCPNNHDTSALARYEWLSPPNTSHHWHRDSSSPGLSPNTQPADGDDDELRRAIERSLHDY
ncbi:hypothetical protein MYAM1_000591 [Malassezia yamatoensis]|uniref:F-box domain-containing protein n=1 Tax=Malassezia yamatoensis TaxID=253288 RepID=A0AAJ6CG50_9BASI|nr:hypothetical protein MYAM1_000591 [Malassezia yamatoensis]